MRPGCVLFDWGDTLMVDFPELSGPMASWSRVEAVPHAVETLERLRRQGWCIALATNANDSSEPEIRAALERVGLDTLIDRVYCSRAIGHEKPSPEFFDFVIADAGFATSDLVMVGDSLAIDIHGANRAGIRGVLLGPATVRPESDRMWRSIADLSELPALLDSWDRLEATGPSDTRSTG